MTLRSEVVRGRSSWSGLRDAIGSPLVHRAALLVLSFAGVVALVWLVLVPGHGFDFYAYWAVDLDDPYRITSGLGAFHYPPPFALLAAPLGAVPFEAGYWLWTAAGLAALAWLTRRWVLAWLLFPPVISELYHGNIHLLMAVALVLGFRAAPAWAFVGIAKVTTGVIGLWPVVRRDWRSAALLGATVTIVVVPTMIVAPGMWADWVVHLQQRGGEPAMGGAEIAIPLLPRLVVAIGLVTWGARTNRRWTAAPAVALAMPVLWVHSLAVLAALPRLVERQDDGGPGGRSGV